MLPSAAPRLCSCQVRQLGHAGEIGIPYGIAPAFAKATEDRQGMQGNPAKQLRRGLKRILETNLHF